VPGAPVHETEN